MMNGKEAGTGAWTDRGAVVVCIYRIKTVRGVALAGELFSLAMITLTAAAAGCVTSGGSVVSNASD